MAGAPSVAQGGQAHQQGETTTLHLGLSEKLHHITMTASRSDRHPMEMPKKPRTKSPNRKVRSMALVLANAFQTSKIEHFLEAESQDITISHRAFHSDDCCSRYIIVTIMNLLMITIPPHPGEVEGQPLPSKTRGVPPNPFQHGPKKKIEKEENIRKPTNPKTDRKAWNPKRMPFVGLEKPGPLGPLRCRLCPGLQSCYHGQPSPYSNF